MKKRPEVDEGGCPLWVVTFGDAMSLLVTFFVMLVSFADFEEHALQDVFGAMKGGLRAVPMPMAESMSRIDHSVSMDAEDQPPALNDADAVLDSGPGVILEQEFKNNPLSPMSDYYIQLLDNGVSLVINQRSAFEYGTATLVGDVMEPWQLAADLLQVINNEVRITVTLPRSTVVLMHGYRTAWGLGIEQALAVQGQLVHLSGRRPEQIGTCVQVVDRMPASAVYQNNGSIEIRFVGSVDAMMKGIPEEIIHGSWREQTVREMELQDG